MNSKFREVKANWTVIDGYVEINSLTKSRFVTWEVKRDGDVVVFTKDNVQVLLMHQDQWEELKRII